MSASLSDLDIDEAAAATEFAYHPLAEIFPLLEGPAFAELVADVLAHGVREPIWLFEGQILDGRNRWRAAREAGVRCRTREYSGDDAAGFVISLNLNRRHLDESQRAMAAERYATLKQGARRDLASIDARSQAEAASRFKVSRSSVQRGHTRSQQGTEELISAVDQGYLKVSAAARLAALPFEQKQSVSDAIGAHPNARATLRAMRFVRAMAPTMKMLATHGSMASTTKM